MKLNKERRARVHNHPDKIHRGNLEPGSQGEENQWAQ